MFMDSAVPNTGRKAPSSRIPNGLALNLELEMRVGGLETSLQSVRQDVSEVKQDVYEMKQDFASTRDEINQLLQTLRPQQAPAEQSSAQPQAPTTKRSMVKAWLLATISHIFFQPRDYSHGKFIFKNVALSP
ncbi:hypothetical protein YC2023_065683 [Brassica napus]